LYNYIKQSELLFFRILVPLEWIFTTAAVITAIGVIVGGIVAIYRLAQTISKSIGLDEKGRTISERLDRVEHQLWENGVTSLADRVNTIESHAIKTTAELEIIKDILIGAQPAASPVRKTRAKKAS
jgi:hypothetical protein